MLIKKQQIGIVEIGIFSSSLLALGLLVWFLSLTFFGSSKDSQAQLIAMLGPASSPAVMEPARAAKARQEAAAEPSTQPQPEAPASLPVSGEHLQLSSPSATVPLPGNEPLDRKENQSPASSPSATVLPPGNEPLDRKAIQPPLGGGDSGGSSPVQRGGADSIEIAYAPKSARDPLLSPENLRYQLEMAELQRKREAAAREAAKPKAVVKTVVVKVDPIQAFKKSIKIGAIMRTDESVMVVIGSEVVNEGGNYKGARILKIIGKRVKFKYKGMIFEKEYEGD